ncbi:hypothetical protein QO011_004167 [Labrys wisconsinensis]|uniref:Uncharacterized protein n=1 Tax=Labrys wisconsinensis TaxID=425677 RepID=A0ABU0JA57_9HYPH|nr:hypothetical protein [Labrys wisconsinensis]
MPPIIDGGAGSATSIMFEVVRDRDPGHDAPACR